MTWPRKFLLGVNYWPRAKAMRWWREYDPREVRDELEEVRALGLQVVRFFLLWEDFQPLPDRVSPTALRCLADVMDALEERALKGIPTLFTGHMSGVNWLPEWILAPGRREDVPFRTVCAGQVEDAHCADIYEDEKLLGAQAELAASVREAIGLHPALFGWDLFNEHSNVRPPVTARAIHTWLDRIVRALQDGPRVPITCGIHQRDLETTDGFRVDAVAPFCDYLSVHAYPFYASWARSDLDPEMAPFCVRLTSSLGRRPAMVTEFGACTRREDVARAGSETVHLFTEAEAADYFSHVLPAIYDAGSLGALAWCFSDYDLSLAASPPFDNAPFELAFGIVRHDGQPKPSARAIERFAARVGSKAPRLPQYLSVSAPAYYQSPANHIRNLYGGQEN